MRHVYSRGALRNRAMRWATVLLIAWPMLALAQTAPPMGQAGSFAVLGGSAVTNTGSTTILGELGVSPANSVSGFPPGTVDGGSIHLNDAVAQQAQADLTIAYNALAGQALTADLSGQDLGGLTLAPGVYRFTSSAALTGTLTLDAQGDPAAVFVFQIGSTLTTASGANVLLINAGSNCNVYWQVGSSATLGTGSTLAGSILALTSITLTTNANVSGRILARNGAVTLDSNTVAICTAGCAPITLQPTVLPNASLGQAYTQAITASGGSAPYVYSLASGALPTGLILSAGGVIAGTPTGTGTFTFTVSAVDDAGCIGVRSYTIIIAPQGCPVITILPSSLPGAALGVPYNQLISASGGTSPYIFGVSAGAVPPGLVLSPAGQLAGLPTTPGNFNFTVTATDAASCPGSLPYALAITTGGVLPTVTALPTLSQWGLALTVLLLVGAVALQRRTR